VSVPVFAGDTAFVDVIVSSASTSARSPVAHRGKQYVVALRGTAWVVTGTRVESAS
jgi:hypothetical protein